MRKFFTIIGATIFIFGVIYIGFCALMAADIADERTDLGSFWTRFKYVTMAIPNTIIGNVKPINPEKQLQFRVDNVVSSIVYIRDPRTNVCYAWIPDKNILTAVPDSIPERLLTTAYTIPK